MAGVHYTLRHIGEHTVSGHLVFGRHQRTYIKGQTVWSRPMSVGDQRNHIITGYATQNEGTCSFLEVEDTCCSNIDRVQTPDVGSSIQDLYLVPLTLPTAPPL
jgi:hypothetical protein